MYCFFDLDYGLGSAYRSIYSDYSSATWTNGYYYNGVWVNLGHYARVVSNQVGLNIVARTSVAGLAMGAFYYNNDPYTVHYYYAQTHSPRPQRSGSVVCVLNGTPKR